MQVRAVVCAARRGGENSQIIVMSYVVRTVRDLYAADTPTQV